MRQNDERVVDADGHVLEPPTGLPERAPRQFRDRIWQVITKRDGSEWLRFNGGERPTRGLAMAGMAGASATEREDALAGHFRYSDMRPGAFAMQPRLADLDSEGIGQAVLYPTLLLCIPGLPDSEFAEVQATAYNEWLADYCAGSHQRLFAVAAVPHQDVERAVRVIGHAKELRHVGVCLRPNPSLGGRPLNDPAYDPIWRVCQELDLVVGLHPFAAPDLPGACRTLGYFQFKAPGVEIENFDAASPVRHLANVFFSRALSHPFDAMDTLAMMICGGVLERFPRLKLLFLECQGGLIVPFLERLDRHFEVFRWDVPWMKLKPSEYFRRQCWISFDPTESTVAATARNPLVGADRIVWASGYPHPDATFPGAVDALRRGLSGLDTAERTSILGLNAIQLYGLPPPSAP